MSCKCHVVVGLAYGDEGKGTTVEAIVRQHNAKLVVRFGGGPQVVQSNEMSICILSCITLTSMNPM